MLVLGRNTRIRTSGGKRIQILYINLHELIVLATQRQDNKL